MTATLETGLTLQLAGRLAEAEQVYRAVLATEARNARAWHLLGTIALQRGQREDAIECFRRALALNPGFAEAYADLGTAFYQEQRFDEAVECFQQALVRNPVLAVAYYNLGNVHRDQGRLNDAAHYYRCAIQVAPTYSNAHNNLGIVLRHLGQLEESLASLQQAVALRPDDSQTHNNLGNTLRDLGRLDAATACYRRAVELAPQWASAHANLGANLLSEGKLAQASAVFNAALQRNPAHAEAHFNQSLLLLLQGDLERGFEGYEWRWHVGPTVERQFSFPRWLGEPLAGKTILIYAEQGFGDTFQFIRYVPLVRALGARVVFECQRPLARLLTSAQGIDQLVAAGDALPIVDYQTPLLSLPRSLKTTLDTVPAQVPYLFAEPSLVAQWQGALGAVTGVRIGINWRGREGLGEFRKRDVPLEKLLELATIPDVSLVNLQKGAGMRELAAARASRSIFDPGDQVDAASGAFMDTAAIMTNLDLVITSDTAIAHLAGALGVPVWVALPFVPDWRWLLGRSDSPWYPTMRLFRQKQPGDWNEVFLEIGCAVRQLVDRRWKEKGLRKQV